MGLKMKIRSNFSIKNWSLKVASVCVVFLSACAPSKGVYVFHETTVGLNGGVNQQSGAGNLSFGYKRKFDARVPRVDPKQTGVAGNALSHANCTSLTTKGIFVTGYTDVTATGRHAGEKISVLNAINPETCSLEGK